MISTENRQNVLSHRTCDIA